MNIINNAKVTNQQIIESGATGYLVSGGKVDINESAEMEEIKGIIEKNCTGQQQEVLLSVISELCQNINDGKEEAKKSSIWIERISRAISSMGDMASISSAAWWPLLISNVENLIQSL